MSKLLIGTTSLTASFALFLGLLTHKDFHYHKITMKSYRDYGKEIEPIRNWQSKNFITRIFTNPHD